MSNKRNALFFLLAVLLQAAVLGAMAGQRVWLLKTGTPVRLACEPVDPRSLFSGDYVRLRYRISRLSPRELGAFNEQRDMLKTGDTVYVALEKDPFGELYRAAEVSENLKDLSGRYPAVLRAKVEGVGGDIRLRYGLEDYFVPQGRGRYIERDLRNVTVEVRVGKDGDSAISRLFFTGKEVRFD